MKLSEVPQDDVRTLHGRRKALYTSVSEIKRKYAIKKAAAQRPATSPPAPQPGTAESTTKSLDDTKKPLKELGDNLQNIFK